MDMKNNSVKSWNLYLMQRRICSSVVLEVLFCFYSFLVKYFDSDLKYLRQVTFEFLPNGNTIIDFFFPQNWFVLLKTQWCSNFSLYSVGWPQ